MALFTPNHGDLPPQPPPGGGFLAPGGSSSGIVSPVAGVNYDGRHTSAQISGGPNYSAPFPTDPGRYLYTQEYWVEQPNFVSLPLDSGGPYGGYHVGESNFKDLGGGILSFTREFALVPKARDEFENFTYTFQNVIVQGGSLTGEGASGSLIETPLTVHSRIAYDYFFTTTPSQISLPRAPRVVNIAGTLFGIHGWGTFAAGQEILAEDATFDCWKGHIYERKRRFVVAQTLGSAI